VTVFALPAKAARFLALGDELRFVLITSQAQVIETSEAPGSGFASSEEGVWIKVEPSAQRKCVRCWHLRADVGSNPAHPELCARCVENVDGPGEKRRFA